MKATGFLSTGNHKAAFKRTKVFAPNFAEVSCSRSCRNSVESSPDSSEDSGENDDKFESISTSGLDRPEELIFDTIRSRRRPKSLIFQHTSQDHSQDHINLVLSKSREKRRHLSPSKLCSIPENDSVHNSWLDLHSSPQSVQGNVLKRKGIASQYQEASFALRFKDELENSTGHRSPVSIENGYRPFSSSPNAHYSFPVINESSVGKEQKDADDRFLVQSNGSPLGKHENQSSWNNPVQLEAWRPEAELQHWLSFMSDFALSLICLVIAVPAILLLYDHYMKQRNPFV